MCRSKETGPAGRGGQPVLRSSLVDGDVGSIPDRAMLGSPPVPLFHHLSFGGLPQRFCQEFQFESKTFYCYVKALNNNEVSNASCIRNAPS